MEKNQEFNKNERQTLKKFLARYYNAKKQRGILQERLIRMKSEFKSGKRTAKIETMINTQIEEAENSAIQIMEILTLLPSDSTERMIMELRHLDCKTWTQIQKAVHLTSSPCHEQYNEGLDRLLQEPKVRKMIGLSKKGAGG